MFSSTVPVLRLFGTPSLLSVPVYHGGLCSVHITKEVSQRFYRNGEKCSFCWSRGNDAKIRKHALRRNKGTVGFCIGKRLWQWCCMELGLILQNRSHYLQHINQTKLNCNYMETSESKLFCLQLNSKKYNRDYQFQKKFRQAIHVARGNMELKNFKLPL